MVLADSGRIARVPPYLGTPLGQSPVSATGLSPSVARLSRRLAYKELVLNAVPQPRPSFLGRFGLFRVRSPLLAESSFLSSPRGTEMFHFPRFARARLFVQRAVRRHYPPWVSPFGHLRIKAWLAAPRSLSQLPASFFASCRLGIHRVPFPAWSPSLLAPASAKTSLLEDQGPARSQNAVVNRRTAPVTLCTWILLFLARMQLSKIANRRGGADRDRTDDFQLAKLALSQLSYGPRWLVGLERFELSTPRLSSVCSNQLSYRPSPLPGSARIRSTSDLQRAEGRPFGPSRLEASPRKTNCALT